MAWLNDARFRACCWMPVLCWSGAWPCSSRPRRPPVEHRSGRRGHALPGGITSWRGLGALAPAYDWAVWLRRTWWAPALGLPTWAWPSRLGSGGRRRSRAVGQPCPPVVCPLTATALGLGALFGSVGALTLLVQDWSAPFTVGPDPALGVRHVANGGWFAAFQLFALVCLVWAAINVGILWHASPPGTPLRWEVVGRLREGRLRRVVFTMPGGHGWALPAYELALFAATELERPGSPTPGDHRHPRRRPAEDLRPPRLRAGRRAARRPRRSR